MNPRNPEPTRKLIIAAASRLLEAGGIEAVTLRGVGEEAGVSRGAPYRHFADKAALLQYLAVLMLTRMAVSVRSAADGKPPKEALRAGCLAYVKIALENPHHYLLIFGDAPVVSPAPEADAAADDAMAAMQELVEGARAAGYLMGVKAREMATLLWVTMHGIAQLQITGHLHEPRTLDGDSHVDDLVGLAIQAYGV